MKKMLRFTGQSVQFELGRLTFHIAQHNIQVSILFKDASVISGRLTEISDETIDVVDKVGVTATFPRLEIRSLGHNFDYSPSLARAA